MGRVAVLPPEVTERIAAGEVVERPASVVKELVENALDAGATRITVDVEAAGLGLIRVADDGEGMDEEDARAAFQRHATSKLASADDLAAVRTLGFRGEALPSIAAVARVTLVTRFSGASAGTRVRVEGGAGIEAGAAGAAGGTLVEVRDLFYNVPARRRFLKSAGREFALIQDAVIRLALAHPHVTFRLTHDGQEALVYPEADLPSRVIQVLGRRVVGRLVEVEEAAGTLYLRAFLGHLEVARSTRAQQFFTINRRPVHSRLLSAAAEQAYHQLLPVGRYPVAALFVDLPPREVDVNIHPRKLEVRFRDERRIFDLVNTVCRRALLQTPLIRRVPAPVPREGDSQTDAGAGAAAPPSSIPESRPLSLYPEIDASGPEVREAGAGSEADAARRRLPAMRLLGQIQRTYLAGESDEGLVLIDQHAAHERVLYERLVRLRRDAARQVQELLLPEVMEVSAPEAALLDESREAFAALGFEVEPFGRFTYRVRAVPAPLLPRAGAQVVRECLADLLAEERTRRVEDRLERLAIAAACHSAVRAGDGLAAGEMEALVRDLAACEDPYTCFHGRPTLVVIPGSHLERWFLRRA